MVMWCGTEKSRIRQQNKQDTCRALPQDEAGPMNFFKCCTARQSIGEELSQAGNKMRFSPPDRNKVPGDDLRNARPIRIRQQEDLLRSSCCSESSCGCAGA